MRKTGIIHSYLFYSKAIALITQIFCLTLYLDTGNSQRNWNMALIINGLLEILLRISTQNPFVNKML